MICIILGVIAFLLFGLYDINSIIMKNKLLNYGFFTGSVLIILATFGILFTSWGRIKPNPIRIIFFGFLSLLFLCFLIYTLFFALPFKKTYLEHTSPKVYQSGVYALCRHPGVLWFIGFYLFLWLAISIRLLLVETVIFSLLNILYIFFQDRWTFARYFNDYDKYKITTPFLIPNRNSIKRCLKTLKHEERV